MVYGLSGALNDDSLHADWTLRCSQKYPSALMEETLTGKDGFRCIVDVHHNKVSLQRKFWTTDGCALFTGIVQNDFRDINVEMFNSVKLIKYINKSIRVPTKPQ